MIDAITTGKTVFWGGPPFPPKLDRPFLDPRDFSTLLYFKPMVRKQDSAGRGQNAKL